MVLCTQTANDRPMRLAVAGEASGHRALALLDKTARRGHETVVPGPQLKGLG